MDRKEYMKRKLAFDVASSKLADLCKRREYLLADCHNLRLVVRGEQAGVGASLPILDVEQTVHEVSFTALKTVLTVELNRQIAEARTEVHTALSRLWTSFEETFNARPTAEVAQDDDRGTTANCQGTDS